MVMGWENDEVIVEEIKNMTHDNTTVSLNVMIIDTQNFPEISRLTTKHALEMHKLKCINT